MGKVTHPGSGAFTYLHEVLRLIRSGSDRASSDTNVVRNVREVWTEQDVESDGLHRMFGLIANSEPMSSYGRSIRGA